MNILIIGSGAREHAIAKTLAQTSPEASIFCYGNSRNPGILKLAKAYKFGDLLDFDTILNIAKSWAITLAIIGPEAPLEKGIVNRLKQAGIAAIGPTQSLARLETSKSFTRNLLQKYKIPGSPRFQCFTDLYGVIGFLQTLGPLNYVIKADGLMGGKGVKVGGDHLHSLEDAFTFCKQLADANIPFLIEEKLQGQEFSLLCFTDGHSLIPMPLVQDHKRAYENDKGPNTGGMGSYSCANHSLPFLTDEEVKAAFLTNQKVLAALQQECQETYQGIIYGSFMATADGVKLIEYNARFGDPEAINILSLFDANFAELCLALTQGCLRSEHVSFKHLATVCKYAVPKGYPDNPIKNEQIDISQVSNPEMLYYAAIDTEDQALIATGSRAIAVLGQAADLDSAEKLAESEIAQIQGAIFHRKDIGTQALIQGRIQHMQQLRKEMELA